jgi:hypothetical protein
MAVFSPRDASLLALLAENPSVSAKDAEETVAAIGSPAARRIAVQIAKKLHAPKSNVAGKAEALRKWGATSRTTRSMLRAKSQKKR